uniref:Secreted protein n=1 Tax=Strongyloides venezuelensis TaxID=75913 RepID=A0A0K0G058_STRVS
MSTVAGSGLGWGRSAYRVDTCLPGVVDRVSVPSVASIDHQWGSPLVIGRRWFTACRQKSPRYDSGRMAHASH